MQKHQILVLGWYNKGTQNFALSKYAGRARSQRLTMQTIKKHVVHILVELNQSYVKNLTTSR